ncbi:sensor histidine kinase [Nitrosopumilus ureiphilus]|uniref:histidine kinase n=2 Tax=Nitrosopumilus ureiphilus TaxID=1470067 RepID=A0A7D5RCK8_9ARCH|nr:sensor histidine kinase [Nitrosopumilus ureiphilus]
MEEINHNFNYHDEYVQKLSNFESMKSKYEKQMRIFEIMSSEKKYVEGGSFWIYNTEIKTDLQDFNDFVMKNQKIDEYLTGKKSLELQKKVLSYYELHLTYENSASELLKYFYEGNQSEFIREYNVVKSLHLELLEKNEEIKQILQIIPIYSKLSTEYIINNFQILQLTMTVIVGIVTTMLVFFLNQISANLKLEIKSQTKNLQKLNNKLRRIDSKRKEFISIASHELKGPIQPIFGFVELAKTEIISKHEALEGIANVALNLENIANNVLDLTKIENNELELYHEKCNINDIIQEVVNSENFNPEKKVPIKTKLDVDVVLSLDKTRIKQVFRNIIDNCIKFTESGEIKIHTHLLKEEKSLKIFCTDSGPEIPKEILPRIFKKFVTHGNGNISSVGLGLYISKKIIDAHNGEISAYNQNKHPVFEITLPLVTFQINRKRDESSKLQTAI